MTNIKDTPNERAGERRRTSLLRLSAIYWSEPSRSVDVPGSPGRFPGLSQQAWDLTRSLAGFVTDGCRTVSRLEYRRRLELCDVCPNRRRGRCLKCGCRLALKARGRVFQCPEGRWDVDL